MSSPVTIERFGGLDLRSDPGEVGFGGATASLNADTRDPGRIQTRPGHTAFATPTTGVPQVLYPTADLFYYVSNITTSAVDSINNAGAVTALGTLGARTTGPPAALGTPTTSVVFFPSYITTLRKSTGGGALANSVGKPLFVATHPVDNRLVQACFAAAADTPTGANGSPSTVFFSDPGAPETYGANNYVHLHPGDGENIQAMATWRELLFVFKATRVFVFYGTSTDATGNPVFNYRTLDLPSPPMVIFGSPMKVTVGRDGVYYVANGGIYRTSGDTPVLVSEKVGAFFETALNDPVGSALRLAWANDRLFFGYTTASGEQWFVRDAVTGDWAQWEWPYKTVSAWPAAFTSPQPLWAAARDGKIVQAIGTATADESTAIAAHYQTGYSDLGNAGEKRIRELILHGSGSPLAGVGVDYGTPDTATAVTLGTAPAVGEGRDRRSRKGRNFSLKLSSTSGAWNVNRASLMVAESRDPAQKGT